MKKTVKKILTNFWGLHKRVVLKNKKLKNIHAGQTCYIFANGASLKYYDISKLPDLPSIVCTFALMDKRMSYLSVRYCTLGESYSLYPFLYNACDLIKNFFRRFQPNKMRPVFKKIITDNQNVSFFINLTNFYSSLCRNKNVNYVYHFGDKTSSSYDMAGNFTTCQGGLHYMIGVAKYLGFAKAILIGCDYLGLPTVGGHFYSDSKPYIHPADPSDHSAYRSTIKSVTDGIDILVILPEGVSSPDYQFDSYENYFGLGKKYTENVEFIDLQYIEWMRASAAYTQVFM